MGSRTFMCSLVLKDLNYELVGCGFAVLSAVMEIWFTDPPSPSGQDQLHAETFSGGKWELLDLCLFLALDRDAHARAHLRGKARGPVVRYAWQDTSGDLQQHGGPPEKVEELFDDAHPQEEDR